MVSIIENMKKIGLDVNEKGMCQGIAMMAIHAYLLGPKEHRHYLERFEKLTQPEPARPSRYEGHDAPNWDVQAFLQGVALFHSPECYPDFFPSNKQLLQSNVEEIAAVVQSNLTQERGGIRKVKSFTSLYNSDEEIDKYLKSYQQAVTAVQVDGEESRCALLLECYNHAIMLAYDVHSGWYLQSHDSRYVLKGENLKSVIKKIRESYRISLPDSALIFSTTVYSLGEAFSAANKVCDLWCDNADWKQIHAVTAEKVKIRGYGGWIFIAAKNGHLEVVQLLLDKGAEVDAKLLNGATPLFVAAQNGHLEVVKALLDKDADVNAAMMDGATSLFIAAQNGHLEVVKALLDKDADVNAAMMDGATSLFIAAKNGHLEVVKALLENRADVDAKLLNGVTPLFIAAQNGHLEVVQVLLDNGADVDAAFLMGGDTDLYGVTPLFIAAQNGHLEVVKALLKNGADVDADRMMDGSTSLHVAAKNGHLKVVKALLENRADVNANLKNGATSLYLAAQNGHLEVVRVLLDSRADIFRSIEGSTEILRQTAITQGREEEFIALKEKLSAKAGKITDFSPLDAALFFCHSEIAMALISAGARVNQEHTLFFWEWLSASLCKKGNTQEASECYKQLEEFFKSRLISEKDNVEITAIKLTQADRSVFFSSVKTPKGERRRPFVSARFPDMNIETCLAVEYLITEASDKDRLFDLRHCRTHDPLHLAICCDNKEAVSYLLEKGMDPNAPESMEGGYLHSAVVSDKNNEEIVRLLLKYGSRLESKNRLGTTPLHLAAERKKWGLVCILIDEYKADFTAINKQGETPFDLIKIEDINLIENEEIKKRILHYKSSSENIVKLTKRWLDTVGVKKNLNDAISLRVQVPSAHPSSSPIFFRTQCPTWILKQRLSEMFKAQCEIYTYTSIQSIPHHIVSFDPKQTFEKLRQYEQSLKSMGIQVKVSDNPFMDPHLEILESLELVCEKLNRGFGDGELSVNVANITKTH